MQPELLSGERVAGVVVLVAEMGVEPLTVAQEGAWAPAGTAGTAMT